MNLERRANQAFREHHRQLDRAIEIGLCASFFTLAEREKERRKLCYFRLPRLLGGKGDGTRGLRARLGNELLRHFLGTNKDGFGSVVRINNLVGNSPTDRQ